jgi:hypothetical protein
VNLVRPRESDGVKGRHAAPDKSIVLALKEPPEFMGVFCDQLWFLLPNLVKYLNAVALDVAVVV